MNTSDAQELLDAIDEKGIGLTDWEIEFLDSLLKQTDRGKPLSDKQSARLQKIYMDRVACFRD